MDLRKLFSLLLSFMCMLVFAQQQEVISAQGKSYENSTGSISFTLGEFMNNTFSSADVILTQGFHQSKIVVVGNQPVLQVDIEILAYPNPAKDYVLLEIEKFQDFSYVLIDMTGRIIERREVVSTKTEINFSSLEPSLYVLKVLLNEEDVRSFKITKY